MEHQQHYEDDTYRKDKEQDVATHTAGETKDTYSLSAMLLGILAVVSLLFGMGPQVMLSLVLGIIGLFMASNAQKLRQSSMAHAGKILSLIAVIISAFVIIVGIIVIASGASFGLYRLVDRTTIVPRMTMMHRFWF